MPQNPRHTAIILPDIYSLLLDSSQSEFVVSAGRISNIEFSNGRTDSAFSISLWVKPAANGANQKILYYGKDNSTDPSYMMRLVSETHRRIPNQIQFYSYDNRFKSYISARSNTNSQIVRGIWNHILVTYSGNGSQTGINFYLNGTKAIPVAHTRGNYVAMSAGSLSHKYYLGKSMQPRSNEYSKVNLSHVGIFDIELTEDEAIECFNLTARVDLTQHSQAANLKDYRKLNNDLSDSSINSHDDLVNNNGSFEKDIYTQLYLNKGSESGYIAFGGAYLKDLKTVYWHGRKGTDHLNGGVITKFEIDLDTFSCIQKGDVIENVAYTFRGGSAGIINGRCVVFTTRYDSNANDFVDIGRFESSDGLIGESFNSRVDMKKIYTRYNFYGKVVSGNTPNEYIVPMYGHNDGTGNDLWKVILARKGNNSSTWNYIKVIDSDKQFGETALINLGDNKFLLVTRNLAGGLYACKSENNLNTFSNYTKLTSLGIIRNAMADMCLDDDGNINLIYADRHDGYLKVSTRNAKEDLLEDLDSWNAPMKIAKSFPEDNELILGYPSIVYIGENKFFISYSSERSPTRSDLMYGIGTL